MLVKAILVTIGLSYSGDPTIIDNEAFSNMHTCNEEAEWRNYSTAHWEHESAVCIETRLKPQRPKPRPPVIELKPEHFFGLLLGELLTNGNGK